MMYVVKVEGVARGKGVLITAHYHEAMAEVSRALRGGMKVTAERVEPSGACAP